MIEHIRDDSGIVTSEGCPAPGNAGGARGPGNGGASAVYTSLGERKAKPTSFANTRRPSSRATTLGGSSSTSRRRRSLALFALELRVFARSSASPQPSSISSSTFASSPSSWSSVRTSFRFATGSRSRWKCRRCALLLLRLRFCARKMKKRERRSAKSRCGARGLARFARFFSFCIF